MSLLRDLSDDYMRISKENAVSVKNNPATVKTVADRQWRAIAAIHRSYYEAAYEKPLDATARAALSTILERQQSFFRRWMEELNDASEGASEEQIIHRARLYLESAGATYQRAATDRLGIPPLPAYPKDGSTDCIVGCRCIWAIERVSSRGNWRLFWEIQPAEHCPHCTLRAGVWNPLVIKEGVIQPYNPLDLFRTASLGKGH